MVEETRQPKNATSLQAGPGEVDHNTLYAINMRVTHLIGRQLAQIGDELDNKWREQLPVQWQPLEFWDLSLRPNKERVLWVSNVSDWSRKTTYILASALLLVTLSIFLAT